MPAIHLNQPGDSEPFSFRRLIPAFEQWARTRRSNATALAYKQGVGRFITFADAHGILTPEEVTYRVVEDFMTWLRETGNCAVTANHRLVALQSFWRWMRREGHATNNPCADAERMKTAEYLPSYLSVPDQEKLLTCLASATGDEARRDEAMIATALLTGARCSELVSLRVTGLDFTANAVRFCNAKGGRSREIPLVARLAAILQTYMPARLRLLRGTDAPWLFVSARPSVVITGRRSAPRGVGSQLARQAFFHLIWRTSERILGRQVSPHALRHSFAMRIRQRGADLQLIQQALGHADISTTTVYARLATIQSRTLLEEFLT